MSLQVLVETLRKLNDEIAQANQAMTLAALFCVGLLAAAYLTSLIRSGNEKALVEFVLVVALSGIWMVANKTTIIQNAGAYVRRAEAVMAAQPQAQQFDIEGWETFKSRLRLRPILLLVSSILMTSIVWYLCWRLVRPYSWFNALDMRLWWVLAVPGVVAIVLAHIFPDK